MPSSPPARPRQPEPGRPRRPPSTDASPASAGRTFARLVGVTPRQLNNRSRGRAAVPRWAALLAVVLQDTMAEALLLMPGDTQLSCHQVLGAPYGADMASPRRGTRRLALLYRPDKGGQVEQMIVVNAAYAEATRSASRASQHIKQGPTQT